MARPKGEPCTTIQVRVTEAERRQMAEHAARDKRPLSHWCRVQLLRAFEPQVSAEDAAAIRTYR